MAKNHIQKYAPPQRPRPIPVPEWKVWWTRIVRSAEAALVVAFLSLAFEFGDDIIYLSLFIAAAWVVAAASVATYESLDQTVAGWEVTSLNPNWIRLLAGVGFALILGVMAFAISHHAEARAALSSVALKQVPEALLEAQLKELTEIEELIGRQDEYYLREQFQLPEMLEHNVMYVISLFRREGGTTEERAEVDRFFAGGNLQVDLRFVRAGRMPGGTIMVFPRAGKICTIHLSEQYDERKARLGYFESSATMPASVRDSVRQFDATLDKDVNLIFDVLNDKYAEDPNNLYLNFDRMVASIRAYLKTD